MRHVSLAACVVFFLEVSLWVHYNAYVKGLYRVTKEELNPKMFIKKENNFINVKNELQDFWISIQEKTEKNQMLLKVNAETEAK
jgi:hypothetical protein